MDRTKVITLKQVYKKWLASETFNTFGEYCDFLSKLGFYIIDEVNLSSKRFVKTSLSTNIPKEVFRETRI